MQGDGLLQPSAGEQLLYGRVTEDDVEQEVRRLARLYRYRCYHTRYSLRSQAGFPDLCLVRPPRVLLAELKRQGKWPTVGRLVVDRRGRARWVDGQLEWLRDLAGCPGVETYLWWPDTLHEVGPILDTGPRPDMVCVQRLAELLKQAGQEGTGYDPSSSA